jgi:predicted membrane protein
MVDEMKATNKAVTWIFRILLAGFICMGFTMLFTPVQLLISIIPFLGKYIGKVSGKVFQIIGTIIGVVLALLIIAVAWIAVRPLVAIPLLLIAAGLIVLAVKRGKKAQSEAPSAEAAADVATETSEG